MSFTPAPPGVASAAPTDPFAYLRAESLALIFQEIFTVIVRLRSNRQVVTDAESFRANMRGALKKAEGAAAARGYSSEDYRIASFAVVAFLDESILSSRNPVFYDWSGKPLQDELFGAHVAGEMFFQSLDRLLGRRDSPALADVLEVYYLCLLLGYRGRYSMSGPEGVRPLMDTVAEKIRRVHPLHPFSLAWVPGGAVHIKSGDPWVKRLFIAAAVTLGIAVLLFVVYKTTLGSGVSGLSAAVLMLY